MTGKISCRNSRFRRPAHPRPRPTPPHEATGDRRYLAACSVIALIGWSFFRRRLVRIVERRADRARRPVTLPWCIGGRHRKTRSWRIFAPPMKAAPRRQDRPHQSGRRAHTEKLETMIASGSRRTFFISTPCSSRDSPASDLSSRSMIYIAQSQRDGSKGLFRASRDAFRFDVAR